MTMYAIYYNPIEFPGRFVVRPWKIQDGHSIPQSILCCVYSLEIARSYIPEGLSVIERSPDDDVSILETWF